MTGAGTGPNMAMLSALIEQAEAEGGDIVMLRAVVEEASMIGAERALERAGLADAGAVNDVRELRDLLGAWRDAKATARAAAIGWIVRAAAMLLLLGIAIRLGLLRQAGA